MTSLFREGRKNESVDLGAFGVTYDVITLLFYKTRNSIYPLSLSPFLPSLSLSHSKARETTFEGSFNLLLPQYLPTTIHLTTHRWSILKFSMHLGKLFPSQINNFLFSLSPLFRVTFHLEKESLAPKYRHFTRHFTPFHW